MITLNFGKHKGKDIRDVPVSYLQWMFSLDTFYKSKIEVKEAVVEILIANGKIKLSFDDEQDFKQTNWISADTPPLETCFVMCNPHNRTLLFSGGNYYQTDTWLRKDDVTHWKPIK